MMVFGYPDGASVEDRRGWRFGCEGSLKHQCQKNQSHDNQHAGGLHTFRRLSKKFSQPE